MQLTSGYLRARTDQIAGKNVRVIKNNIQVIFLDQMRERVKPIRKAVAHLFVHMLWSAFSG